ncbi:MAG: hypothetical protein J6W00_08560 [Lentisphaeria bacterium]|nr:hypothetical protein [Lentisphaeria bacterium]
MKKNTCFSEEIGAGGSENHPCRSAKKRQLSADIFDESALTLTKKIFYQVEKNENLFG